ncbi:MAG: hypothetical protein DRJ31_10200 [Candidatus Methanomethylicota archaeon]|uniref:Uncharacterized protein n=1 Tax=Thermoproteota archaeon TaxID=2056631 RepID=A0A497EK56_9CREN|nr:MAG: hypothetical protein DRJ31_10200 [Candidatus Verstraetearchaeota archaeon]
MPNIRLSEETYNALRELKWLMSIAFGRELTFDEVIATLIQNRVELEIDVGLPKELIKDVYRGIRRIRREEVDHVKA